MTRLYSSDDFFKFTFYFHTKIDFKQNPKITFDTVNEEGLEHTLPFVIGDFDSILSNAGTFGIGFVTTHFQDLKKILSHVGPHFKLYTVIPICTRDYKVTCDHLSGFWELSGRGDIVQVSSYPWEDARMDRRPTTAGGRQHCHLSLTLLTLLCPLLFLFEN